MAENRGHLEMIYADAVWLARSSVSQCQLAVTESARWGGGLQLSTSLSRRLEVLSGVMISLCGMVKRSLSHYSSLSLSPCLRLSLSHTTKALTPRRIKRVIFLLSSFVICPSCIFLHHGIQVLQIRKIHFIGISFCNKNDSTFFIF